MSEPTARVRPEDVRELGEAVGRAIVRELCFIMDPMNRKEGLETLVNEFGAAIGRQLKEWKS